MKKTNWFPLLGSREAHRQEELNLIPEKDLHNRETSELLTDLLKAIPEEQRTVIIMKEYEGLKFREIAEALGISENTVKSRLYYGLKGLRNMADKNNLDLKSFIYGK
jgi:RNA polymerase sigma-70 factor (ECF subfamily)